jgi:hypothetical protein
MLAWLLQAGPKAAKHRGKSHPLVTFCLHYAMVALITVSAHDWIIATARPEPSASTAACSAPLHREYVGFFLGIYFVLYFGCRLALHWHQEDFFIEFYKQTFLCSVTIFCTALGLYTNRPILAESFCIAVGIDQFSWYIDLGGKILLYVRSIIDLDTFLISPALFIHAYVLTCRLWSCYMCILETSFPLAWSSIFSGQGHHGQVDSRRPIISGQYQWYYGPVEAVSRFGRFPYRQSWCWSTFFCRDF